MVKPIAGAATAAAYTHAEATELVGRAGLAKGLMAPEKIFLSGVSAGCILAFGCAVSLITGTAPWYQENAPGLIRIISAASFPLGFVILVLTGADLFTGANMMSFVAVLQRKLSVPRMLLQWTLLFFGNLAGSLFFMSIFTGYGGTFDSDPYKSAVITFVTRKQLAPAWHQIFIRAIGCNWLVCLACFLGMQGKDLASKIMGLWFPIFAFVALGFDHVVANMFFIPLGIWLGTPGLTVGLYIWKGIIPVLIGNVLGGSLFCGTYYWYMNLAGQSSDSNDHHEVITSGQITQVGTPTGQRTPKILDEESGLSSIGVGSFHK